MIQDAVSKPPEDLPPGPVKHFVESAQKDQSNPPGPFDGISDDDVKGLAKSLGLTVKGLKDNADRPGVKQLIDAVRQDAIKRQTPAEEPPTAQTPAGQEIAPPAAGNVRFYHGGVDYEGGPRWLTPSRAYAEGYAAKNASEGARTHYVDLPEDHPLVQAHDQTEELTAGTNMKLSLGEPIPS